MATILVADDNSNIQKMVTLALKDQGIDVIAVGNGEAAVRKLPDLRPDLVLADIFMPVRNGYEVCEFVKQDARFAHIPVILLVGAFDPLDEHEAQRVGADGVLKKPFVPPDPLISMVKTVLAKSAGERLVPIAVPAAPAQVAAPAEFAAPTALEAEEEPAQELFGTHPERIAFGEGEKPLAFGEMLEAPAAEPEPDADVTSLRDSPFGDMNFWESSTAAEKTEAETAESEWSPSETGQPRRDGASPPRPIEFDAEEPPEGFGEEATPWQAEPAPLPESASSASEWVEGASARSPAPLTGEKWPDSAPVAAELAPWAFPAATNEEAPAPQLNESIPSASAGTSPPAWEVESEAVAASAPPATESRSWEELAQQVAEEAAAAALRPSAGSPEEPAPALPVERVRLSAPAESVAQGGPTIPDVVPPAQVSPAPGGGVQTYEVPQPADAEVVDAVVAKVLERMKPEVIDIVTREILKPVVEALVRRELEKH